MNTLEDCSTALAEGATSARALVEGCLERALDPAGEGQRVFIELKAAEARAEADRLDQLRRQGEAPGPWAGIPITVKDLFDLSGETTRAGSVLLDGTPPAAADAPVVARLKAAGFVVVGRTNMTEFAYSGVGMNPHYGTPLNPFDRARRLIPGGSSSGAAVSVTDGMALAGIGTDTGGSCRIPAALCGIAGYKPTASRIPLTGVYPLAPSLDSVGPLANRVRCCAVLDDVMAGGIGAAPQPREVAGLTVAVLENYVTEDLDDKVARDYQTALSVLDRHGIRLLPLKLPAMELLPELNSGGGIAAAEAWRWHRAQLEARQSDYDPRVGSRIAKGAGIDAAALEHLQAERSRLIEVFVTALRGVDVMLAPTVPTVAPPFSVFEADADYARLNLQLLRNPSLINFLDGCAISMPMHEPGTAPTGLMLAAPAGRDVALLGVAETVERLLDKG